MALFMNKKISHVMDKLKKNMTLIEFINKTFTTATFMVQEKKRIAVFMNKIFTMLTFINKELASPFMNKHPTQLH
jgi:hypothetical protein